MNAKDQCLGQLLNNFRTIDNVQLFCFRTENTAVEKLKCFLRPTVEMDGNTYYLL